MKTKFIYTSFLASILMLLMGTSCNDSFMDQFPPDKINDANYWKSPTDLRLYSNQFYEGLSAISAWSEDNLSDNQAPSNRQSFIWNETVVPSKGGGWEKKDWENIRKVNYFLEHYGRVTGNQEEIEKYLGEILFFKSLYYYDKVKRFGDVPWLERGLNTNSEELFEKRDSRKLVMDSISENLDRAIKFLPKQSKDNRITSYAAAALKARICLFEGTFRKYHSLGDEEKMLRRAADAAHYVMQSNLFELHSTGNPDKDFAGFFILQNLSDSKESIFHIEYIEDLRTNNAVRTFGESGTGMTKDFARSFLCIDGLPISLSTKYKGDDTYMDEFENRDPRMRQSIHTPDQPTLIEESGVVHYTEAPLFVTSSPTGYRMWKKHSPYAKDREYERCAIDDCLFRYAEVLLNYAEAKAELNECNNQVLEETVNLLRKRVGMPSMTSDISFTDTNWPNWEVSVSPLLNEIRRERRVELVQEGFRWDDLRRWKAGKLLENVDTYLGARDPNNGNKFKVLYENQTRKWDNKLYLYPIPTDELKYNDQLKQNPGWEK